MLSSWNQSVLAPRVHAWCAQWQSRRKKQPQVLSQAAHCRALSLYLREPCAAMRGLLRRHARYQRRLDYNRHHVLSSAQLQRLQQSFEFSQQQAYAQLLHSDPRSRIVAAFHCGDYVFGMNAFVSSVIHDGMVKVLSQRAATAAHWQNIRTAFGAGARGQEAELLRVDTAPTDLSAFLRARNNTLLLFCDLPAGNGERIKVKFLGRDTWFPRGATTLAVANRVPLLPVISLPQGRGNQILLFPQLESASSSGVNTDANADTDINTNTNTNSHVDEAIALRVQRLTQSLADILEQVVLLDPVHWRYLPSLPLYFTAPPHLHGGNL